MLIKTRRKLRMMQKLRCLPAILLSLCFLVACGTSSQPSSSQAQAVAVSPTSTAALTAVDWADFTYSSSCYGNTQPFKAHNGKAQNSFIRFEIYSPIIYGDLTGDGQPEAVIRYSCTGADFGGVHVFVYSGTTSHPVLLGDLPSVVKNEPGGNWGVEKVTVANQTLQLTGRGYSASAPHCCPDLQIAASYHWDGKHFVSTQFKTMPFKTP
jgi:hypothetical protein